MYVGVELEVGTKGMSYLLQVVHTYNSGIDLSQNKLTGNIPPALGLLQGLDMLNLSHNSFTGYIPTTIGNMSGLESLDISFNDLSGEIPTQLTLLDSLSVLNLSFNNLSGEIPRGAHFDTVAKDGLAYIGNRYLCGAPGGMNCTSNIGNSDTQTMEVENARERLYFYGVVTIGYAVGFWGFFLSLKLMKEKWRECYWNTIDNIILRTRQGLLGVCNRFAA